MTYSSTYLDGEARQAYFIKWLCTTLACVSSLVIAGELVLIVIAWIGTSLSFHKLLLYYPDRPAAVRAARKKFIAARIGDFALVSAAVLMVSGTAPRTSQQSWRQHGKVRPTSSSSRSQD